MTTRRIAGWVLVVAVLAGLGCASYERGRLTLASVRKVEAPFRIIKQDAEGTSCASMFDARYEHAVQDALARSPGANALVGASWYFEKLCITVRGTAVYFPQPLPAGDDPRDAGDDPRDAPNSDDVPGGLPPGDEASEDSSGDDHSDSTG